MLMHEHPSVPTPCALQAAACFMIEFYKGPGLDHEPLTDDEELQADFDAVPPASCARLVHGTSICYIRVDVVRVCRNAKAGFPPVQL